MKDEDVNAIILKLKNEAEERNISRLEIEQEMEAKKQAREMSRGMI